VARLASPETVRFTAAQRDALIDLAARLQAEQEATVGMDELARAAEEAGVDPRFLSEAARRLETPAEVGPREAIAALAGLALFDALFFGIVARSWLFPMSPMMGIPLLAVAAFAFAWIFGRPRALRWVAPLAPVAVWTALGIAAAFAYRFHGDHRFGLMLQRAATFGLIQAASAAFASFLRRDP